MGMFCVRSSNKLKHTEMNMRKKKLYTTQQCVHASKRVCSLPTHLAIYAMHTYVQGTSISKKKNFINETRANKTNEAEKSNEEKKTFLYRYVYSV